MREELFEEILSLVEEYIRKTKGKTLEEIEIPIPSREPEDLFNVNYSDLSMVYRYRLMLEASLKTGMVMVKSSALSISIF